MSLEKENCSIPLEGCIKMEDVLVQKNSYAKDIDLGGEDNIVEKGSTKNSENRSPDSVEDYKLNVKAEEGNNDSAEAKMPHTECNVASESDDSKCDIPTTVDVENITNTLAEKVNLTNSEPCNSGLVNPQCDIQNVKEEGSNMIKTTKPTEEEEKVLTGIQRVIELREEFEKVSDECLKPQSNRSNVVLNHTTDSLKNLLVYDSSSSSDEEELTSNWQFRTINKSDNDSEDMSSSSSDDDDDGEIAQSLSKKSKSKDETNPESLKVYSDNNIRDLPPIRDVSNLDIDVEKEEFLHIGNVEAVIETLITVEAIPGTPAYDLDTCLFIEKDMIKRPLGAIYDVIGPVTSPLYCIRFQYASEISNLDIKKGMKVFCAPKSKYTQYVFVKELMKHKGTDASWVGDVELPPEIAAQLSDDECQAEPQEPRKPQKRKHGSQERHRQFEEDMNRCNTLHSQAARLVDAQRHFPRISRYNDHVQRTLFTDVARPVFDPTVPPPGFHGFPRHRAPAMVWNRFAPVGSSRSRCPLFGHSEGNPNGYAGHDVGPDPGTSSHPY